MSSLPHLTAKERDETSEIAELEALSRTRALTRAESCRLELLICQREDRRRSYGLTKEMARAGLKRSGRAIP
jgi:hypothetical protein